jgi:hypothetical protein
MKDPIVQEVRDARAAVAEDFGFDLHQFFAWAKTHKKPETPVEASVHPVARKRRVRADRV